MPVMVISGGDIRPTTARQSPENAHTGNQFRQRGIGTRGEDVPQEDQGKPGTGGDGNKNLEEGPFGVSIANCRGHGGEPFIGVAVVFILHDLVEVQRDTDK